MNKALNTIMTNYVLPQQQINRSKKIHFRLWNISTSDSSVPISSLAIMLSAAHCLLPTVKLSGRGRMFCFADTELGYPEVIETFMNSFVYCANYSRDKCETICPKTYALPKLIHATGQWSYHSMKASMADKRKQNEMISNLHLIDMLLWEECST